MRFPRDIVAFGDVRVGDTTAYQDLPDGVFREAALTYIRNGRPVKEPVVDFLGGPQSGNFTYEMRFSDVELGRDLIRNLLIVQKVIQDR